jgi:chaperonin GroES
MERMKLKPVRNMMVCDVVPEEKMTKGGLIIPGSARRNPYKLARVLGIGPGHRTEAGTYVAPPFEVGDLVILAPQAGVEVEYDDEKYLMVDADETLAVINEP